MGTSRTTAAAQAKPLLGARQELGDYREWLTRLRDAGLHPRHAVVELNAPAAQTRFVSAQVGGQRQLVVALKVPGERLPPGLERVLADHGVETLALAKTPAAQKLLAGAVDVPAPKRTVSGRFAQAQALSERLMADRGIPAHDDYALMRYTLARYLFDGLPPESLSFLEHAGVATVQDLLATAGLGARAELKVTRLLAEPYTNAQALAQLDAHEETFRRLVSSVKALHPDADYELFLEGSAVKARFTGSSDVDLAVVAKDPAVRQDIVTKRGLELTPAERREFQIARGRKETTPLERPEPLGDGTEALTSPGLFLRVFARRAREWGVEVKDGGAVRVLPRAGKQLEREVPQDTYSRLNGFSPVGPRVIATNRQAVFGGDLDRMPLERMADYGKRLLDGARAAGLEDEDLFRALANAAGRRVNTEPTPEAAALVETLDPSERLLMDLVLSSDPKRAKTPDVFVAPPAEPKWKSTRRPSLG